MMTINHPTLPYVLLGLALLASIDHDQALKLFFSRATYSPGSDPTSRLYSPVWRHRLWADLGRCLPSRLFIIDESGLLAAPTRHRMCHYHCHYSHPIRNPSLLVPFHPLILLAYIFLFALLALLYAITYTTPRIGI